MGSMATDPMTYLINVGVLGVVMVLWLTGMITGKRELDRASDRAEEWKVQYERESAAHKLTMQALERERDRMDAATESACLVTTPLGALRPRSIHARHGGGRSS